MLAFFSVSIRKKVISTALKLLKNFSLQIKYHLWTQTKMIFPPSLLTKRFSKTMFYILFASQSKKYYSPAW